MAWLRGVPDGLLHDLITHSIEVQVKRGDMLLREGDALDVVFVVMRGLLVLEKGPPTPLRRPPPNPHPTTYKQQQQQRRGVSFTNLLAGAARTASSTSRAASFRRGPSFGRAASSLSRRGTQPEPEP